MSSTATAKKPRRKPNIIASAPVHRPASKQRPLKKRRQVLDLFSGFGGLTLGFERAGFNVIIAANHNAYKIDVHEANHPHTEHFIADLVDTDAPSYYSAADLPYADILVAGVACTSHSSANAKKAYAGGIRPHDIDDPEWERRVRKSERERATTTCFPAGVMVLTRQGQVPIEELNVGDLVLTHENRWRPVVAKASRQASTVLVRGRGHAGIEVTGDHPFLARPAVRTSRGWTYGAEEWVEAADLKGYAWQSPVEFPRTELPAAPVGWSYDDDGFWWTVGRWLGDGYIANHQPSGSSVHITCGHAERAELENRWAGYVSEGRTALHFNLRGSGQFARWLREHFGEHAAGKRLPTWLLGADAEIRKRLLEGYLSADGSSGLDGRRGACFTISRRLAIGLKLLLQSLGYRPSLGVRPAGSWEIEGRSGRTNEGYVLQWMAEQRRESTIKTIEGRAVGRVLEVAGGREDVEVFDIEVADDHSFVADGLIVHNCVLQYAAKHHPWMMLIECTTELTSWGDALPGTNIGDGSAFRWWLEELEKLGYRYKIDYPNSAFHGVPQSRDRLFIVFWDRSMRAPDTEHRPEAMCSFCDRPCEAKWSWKTGVPPTGRVQWGKQWEYRCPSCNMTVIPPRRPCIDALDLSDLGQVIGERDRPLAESTMRRVERCIERMKTYPLAMTHLDASGKQHRALVTPAALATLAGNTFEWPGSDCRIRSLAEPMWTQSGTNTMGIVTPPAVAGAVVTYRSGVLPTSFADPTPTQAGHEALALVTASVMPFRANTLPATLGEPMSTQTGECRPAVITGAFIKQNGKAHDTAPHPLSDPMGTITSRDTTGLVTVELIDDFLEQLHSLTPEKARLRMFKEIEVQRGCGFPDDFVVWGSAADQVDGFGNAVSPPLGEFYARRMAAVL